MGVVIFLSSCTYTDISTLFLVIESRVKPHSWFYSGWSTIDVISQSTRRTGQLYMSVLCGNTSYETQ